MPMFKDESRREAYGSVHKGNALDGARILLENFKVSGREKRGVSNVFITKDRPGYLRSHGKECETPGRTFMGVLAVDDTHTFKPFEMSFYKPRDDDEVEAAAASFGLSARTLADDVRELVFALPEHTVASTRALKSQLRGAGHKVRAAKVDDAVDDLVRDGRLIEVFGKRGAKGYQAVASDSEDESESGSESG